jgi:hypothetical protein
LESVVITHPVHPFLGRSVPVLRWINRLGRALVMVRFPDGGTAVVPLDWTDQRPHDFTVQSLASLVRDHGLARLRPNGAPYPCLPARERDDRGRYSTFGLQTHYRVSEHTVRYWIQRGLVTPQQDYLKGPFWFELTPDAEARIKEALRTAYGPRSKNS